MCLTIQLNVLLYVCEYRYNTVILEYLTSLLGNLCYGTSYIVFPVVTDQARVPPVG